MSDAKQSSSYEDVRNMTLGELNKPQKSIEHPEWNLSNVTWEQRYARYYDGITLGEKYVKAVKNSIRVHDPIRKYISVGRFSNKNNKKGQYGVSIDLRIVGYSVATYSVAINEEQLKDLSSKNIQSIATIVFKKAGLLNAAKAYENESKEISDELKSLAETLCMKEESGDESEKEKPKEYNWRSKQVDCFRQLVHKIGPSIRSEHSVESKLIEFMENSNLQNADSNTDLHIKPCELYGIPYQLVTPLKASDAKKDIVCYALSDKGKESSGGGIDILARYGRGKDSRLCVVEIKDNYEKSEKPDKAMKQAIAYSVFLLKLIRSDKAKGEEWCRNIFGYPKFNKEQPLTINAVVAMPFEKNHDTATGVEEIKETKSIKLRHDNGIEDTICLHYLFFKKEDLNDSKKKLKVVTSL